MDRKVFYGKAKEGAKSQEELPLPKKQMNPVIVLLIFTGIAVALMVSENIHAVADCRKEHSAYYCENGGAIDYVRVNDD